MKRLPRGTELVTAGFPCQDLSQAGRTRGIEGARSGLVDEVFRLLQVSDVPNVLIENVSFMLQLEQGRAMQHVTERLQSLGYRWAYRVLDSQAFGLPQRRQRVFLFASRERDPIGVLFGADAGDRSTRERGDRACGFYWTEGERGLGWAVDAVPTLKGGSTVGIPSPPAIWMPDGSIVTPDIRDVERMQGFPADWTIPTARVARETLRWKQMGNAVSVPVAEWLGRRIARPEPVAPVLGGVIRSDRRWPMAACERDGEAFEVSASMWPIAAERPSLVDFLTHPVKPLSQKATLGFLRRLHKGQLRLPPGFLDAVEAHLIRVGGIPPTRPTAADRINAKAAQRDRRRAVAQRSHSRVRAAVPTEVGSLFE